MRALQQKFSKETIAQAEDILRLYRFYKLDGQIYLSQNESAIRDLFDAVVYAIDACTTLKAHLPYQEFIHPSREVLRGDAGWVGHFAELDNCKFFLSDIYDFLELFFGTKAPKKGI